MKRKRAPYPYRLVKRAQIMAERVAIQDEHLARLLSDLADELARATAEIHEMHKSREYNESREKHAEGVAMKSLLDVAQLCRPPLGVPPRSRLEAIERKCLKTVSVCGGDPGMPRSKS